MIVTISTRALRELDSIRDWIARDNPVRADSYVAELIVACEELSEFPRRYNRVRFGNRLLHQRTYENYLIYFEVKRNTVKVVSFRHGARDPSTLG